MFIFDASYATSSIPKLPSFNTDKELVKTVDLASRGVTGLFNAVLVNVCGIGSTEKVIQVNKKSKNGAEAYI
ncbi:MAG: hypothetical protein ACFHU9_15185 [Fluviicola sp.]